MYRGAKRPILNVLHLAFPSDVMMSTGHQMWVSRDDCDQKNGMFLHRNEKLRPPVIREMSGQTPRGTFNRLEFWNAVPPGHLMKTLRQLCDLEHTGTGFIGNAYLLRLYESINDQSCHSHQPRAGTSTMKRKNAGRGGTTRPRGMRGQFPHTRKFGCL